MRVLVTGAGGFVGKTLCRSLHAEKHEVIGLSRNRPKDWTGHYIEMDLAERSPSATQLVGVEAIVHLASRVHQGNETSSDLLPIYRKQISEATVRLAEAAARANVKRFVFLSSVKAAGERSAGHALSTQDPAKPVDPYGVAKLEAEEALAKLSVSLNFELAVIRPPLVYGPGVRANFLQLLKLVDRGIPLPFSSVRNRRSLVYVENLVSALIRCLEIPSLPRGVFYVADDEPLSTNDLVIRMATALHREARTFSIPVAVLRAAGRLSGQSGKIQRLTEDLEVDGIAFKTSFQWTPPFSTNDGLAETVKWYRKGDQ